MKTNKRSPGRACGYRGALTWTRPGALIFGTEPMDLEAEAEAALLADELLARLVFERGVQRAWRRRGFALGRLIRRILAFPALALCVVCRATATRQARGARFVLVPQSTSLAAH